VGDLPFCQARVRLKTVTWEKDLLGTDFRSPEAGSRKKDPPYIGCSRLSSVLVVYCRLLARWWTIRGLLIETRTGFAFFWRCPRLLATGG
jgi:hypothetical protein